jgi:hypothetical protein
MTKYILNSGGLKANTERSKAYFAELLEGLGNKPKLLWCFFATLPDDCEVRFERYTKLFESRMPENVHPLNENARVESFEEQVKKADAIYLHGGRIAPLYEILEKYDIAQLFAGKSVGTNSASSMVLAEAAWSCDEREATKGLGFFPFKYLAHYQSDYGADDPRGPINWDQAYKDLEEFGDVNLPMHALKEGEFIIIKK